MRSVLNDTMYNGLELNYTAKNYQGFYREALDAINSLMQYMIQHHSQVYFIRFDLHYPSDPALSYPDDNVLLSRFTEALSLHCKRRNYDPKYIWARENPGTSQTHYHFMLLLNADLIQNAYGVIQKATELWQRCLGIADGNGLVHLCKSDDILSQYCGGVKIKRKAPDFQQVFAQCFQRASYLAKRFSKGTSPAYVNEFGCSRLPLINDSPIAIIR